MDNYTLPRIDSILTHIDKVLVEAKGLTIEDLKKSDLLLRATCFSISQIGEMMNQLFKALGEKYFALPWTGAKGMRNSIVHDYGHADFEQIYKTINEDLPELKISFLAIKNDLEFNKLVTDRLVLRKVSVKDIEPMFKNWASDPEVTKYLSFLPHEDTAVTEKIIKEWIDEEKDPKTIRYLITTKENDEPIGSIDVVNYKNGAPEIGYCLSRKHWNKGYMTEACKALIKYLFAIGFSKIVIAADVRNIASNRVIEKCGFTFTHKEVKDNTPRTKPESKIINCYQLTK